MQAATLELEEQAEIGGKGGRGNSFHFLKQVVSLLALDQLGRHGSLLKAVFMSFMAKLFYATDSSLGG